MADEDIIQAARKLGETIAASPEAGALKQAREGLNNSEDTKQLLNQTQQHVQTLQQKEQQGQPLEPEDKQKMEKLQGELMADPTFKSFNAAQVEYVDLMRKVNDTLREQLADIEGE
ncbi:MAG: YlbF family regulator [Planctomycetota bacterium]